MYCRTEWLTLSGATCGFIVITLLVDKHEILKSFRRTLPSKKQKTDEKEVITNSVTVS